MHDLEDADLQRTIQITSLLRSGGWKIVKEKLSDLKACYEAELQLLLTDAVNSEKVALLNYRLGRITALNAVLAIQDELVEEITPSDGDTSEVAKE